MEEKVVKGEQFESLLVKILETNLGVKDPDPLRVVGCDVRFYNPELDEEQIYCRKMNEIVKQYCYKRKED